jgi:hypothetical protein
LDVRKLASILAVFSSLASCALAANYSNEVLALGVGARAMGMGGAFVGLVDDSTSVYWNPAGLAHISHVEVSTSQQGQQLDNFGINNVGSRYTFISGGMSFPSLGSFGLGLMRFSVGDIPYVTGLDASGAPIIAGSFGTQDLAVFTSFGKKLLPALDAGATLKVLFGGTQGLPGGDTNYNYYGLDFGLQSPLGALAPVLDGLSLGMNLQDALNSGVHWSSSASDGVDLNLKTGLAYLPPLHFLKALDSTWALVFDVDPKYSPAVLYHAGTEYWYGHTLGLRGGARIFGSGGQSTELSGGLSFRFEIYHFFLQVDYAYVNYELTPVQYISLSGSF